jgi:hypothetical protein
VKSGNDNAAGAATNATVMMVQILPCRGHAGESNPLKQSCMFC